MSEEREEASAAKRAPAKTTKQEAAPVPAREIATRAELVHLRKEVAGRPVSYESSSDRLGIFIDEAPSTEPVAYVEIDNLLRWATT